MSSAVAGKFQDHYEVLGVDPKANSETIQKAYARLAQKYHPSNPDTGDLEKFEAVNLAFEVLSDPHLRPEFDKIKGVDDDKGPPKFNGEAFFNYLGREQGLRTALLCVLYDRRRNRPFTPSLTMRHLENLLTATGEELTFVLWYLKQRNLVQSDDKSSLQITVTGIDFLEENQPTAKMVMPFIKSADLPAPSAQPAVLPAVIETPEPSSSVDREDARSNGAHSVLAALGRALAREEANAPAAQSV